MLEHVHHKVCLVSNLVMLFPAMLALRFKMPYAAAAIIVCMLLSMIYHFDEENEAALFADVCGVIILHTTLSYTMLQSVHIMTPMNLISFSYGIAALVCYNMAGDDTNSELYKEYHTCWHVLVAYMIAATLYSFVNSSINVKRSRLVWPLVTMIPETQNQYLLMALQPLQLLQLKSPPLHAVDGAVGGVSVSRAKGIVPMRPVTVVDVRSR